MSFANRMKEELLEIAVQEPEQLRAQAYGMLLFGRTFDRDSISVQTENRAVADFYCRCILELVGISASITIFHKNKGNGIFVVTVDDQEDRCKILRYFGHRPEEINLRIHLNNISSLSMAAFLRGAYLVCGSITDPAKGYHFEFVVPHLRLSQDLRELLGSFGSSPKQTERRGAQILYYKESEQIEDLLTLMGAVQRSLEIMNMKIYKDFRNKVNRVTNCETANIEKTVAAASGQVEDILLIYQVKGEEGLSEDLQEIARLRLENPEMSLRELGEVLSEPISRSGVNHRLKRISKLAEEIRSSRVGRFPEEERAQ